MSGSWFFVGHTEVLSFTLEIKLWILDISDRKPSQVFSIIPEAIVTRESKIMEAHLSTETTELEQLLAGYVANKIIRWMKCNECKRLMTVENDDARMNQKAK